MFDSPTGRCAYDNRNTRLTKWLNDGIPPARVAEWARNSVVVLLSTCARCIERAAAGPETAARSRGRPT
ncbi:hypothetical protein GCM10022207_14200 [Streptomyces lannensis]|uniref:Integrase n=1 Tax=Streptomyces lannensis TaxID=766498 RepID=A0ABP7JS79_9ACTN